MSMSASLNGGVLGFGSFTGVPGAWLPKGGTSEAAPKFAGIVVIADQYTHKRLGLINPALSRLEQEHAPGIVDVTHGSNTVSFMQNSRTFTLQGYQARTNTPTSPEWARSTPPASSPSQPDSAEAAS